MLDKLLDVVRRSWLRARFWYRVLNPAGVSLFGSMLVWVLFIVVPQGGDILRRVGAARDFNSGGTLHLGHVAFLLGALFVLGLTSWGWARLLLDCDFPTTPKRHGNVRVECVAQGMRRCCGLAPGAGMALAFFVLCWKLHDESKGASLIHGELGCCCLVIAALQYAWFEIWHRKFSPTTAIGRRRHTSVHSIMQDNYAVGAVGSSYVLTGVMAVLLTACPVVVGQALGSAAVVLLALASWIAAGSTLIYFGHRYRVPVVAFALLLALLSSPFNDNHAVRVLDGRAEPGSSNIDGALDAWFDNVTTNYATVPDIHGKPSRPLFLVSSSGGGIRAAYWAALVLAEIEDRANTNETSFAENTFGLSGVSGGSLGELTFTGLLANGPSTVTYRERTQWLLDQDFLAADLAKMGFADLLQRFLPFKVESWDRARSLEEAWEHAWDRSEASSMNPFSKSIGSMYATAHGRGFALPHIFLNGTSVEKGTRIITSDLLVTSRYWDRDTCHGGDLLDIIPAAEALGNRPIRLSTAAHQSARFTYFSPPGRLAQDNHVVDGGYFENSGATTMMDVLQAVRRHIKDRIAHHRSGTSPITGKPYDHEGDWDIVRPKLIIIDNNPYPVPGEKTTPPSKWKLLCQHLERKFHELQFLGESLAPVRALLNTRDARGEYAMQHAADYASQDQGSTDTAKPVTHDVFEFFLYRRKDVPDLPLGWTLSGDAISEMNDQVPWSEDDPVGSDYTRNMNAKSLSRILELLPAKTPKDVK